MHCNSPSSQRLRSSDLRRAGYISPCFEKTIANQHLMVVSFVT